MFEPYDPAELGLAEAPPPGLPPFGPYGQPPAYGQPPPYGQPSPYGYGYPPPAVRLPLRFGVVAATLAGLGTLLVLAALTGLDWYSFAGGQSAGDVRTELAGYGAAANGVAVAYFTWFGWVLLLVCAAAAAVAALPVRGLSVAFRIAGPILAALAMLFTIGSIELIDPALATSPAVRDYYYENLGTGFWVALLGYLLIGAGAIVGPVRRPVAPNHPPR